MQKKILMIVAMLLISTLSACTSEDNKIYLRDFIEMKSDIEEGVHNKIDINTLVESEFKIDKELDHQYFNGSGIALDKKQLEPSFDQTYIFEDEEYRVQEVLLRRLKLINDYKIANGMQLNRDNNSIILTAYASNQNVAKFMQATFPYNEELSIYPNYNRLDMYLIPEQIMTIYFTPIVYKITYQDQDYYTLKTCIADSDYKLGGAIFMAKGTFSDGIFDIVHREDNIN